MSLFAIHELRKAIDVFMYSCFDPLYHKFYTFTNVIFLNQFHIFLLLLLLLYLSLCLVLVIWRKINPKPLQVYTKHFKNVVSTLLTADPIYAAADLILLILLLYLRIFHLLLLRCILILLETWIFLLHIKKINDLVLHILFLILFSMIVLLYYLVSLPYPCPLFLCLSHIRKYWCTKIETSHEWRDGCSHLTPDLRSCACISPGPPVVSCRWVFTIKYHLDGTVAKYKARLIARGFT